MELKNILKDSFAYQELARAGKILRYSKGQLASTLGLVSFLGATYGCGTATGPVTDSKPEIVSSYLSPTSGVAPLQVDAKLTCKDDHSISSYTLVNGQEQATSKFPIDTTLMLNEARNITLKCKDDKGQETVYGPVNVRVTQPQKPTISQLVHLNNLIDVLYAATVANIDSLRVRVLRDKTPIDSFDIKNKSLFTRTYNSAQKGTYHFIASGNGLATDTASINLPDYDAVVDTSGIGAAIEMDEEGTKTVNLETRVKNSDPNPEDNPVSLDRVESVDGKIEGSVNGYNMTISALGDNSGTYGINIFLKNSKGKTTSIPASGEIHDIPKITGNLESNEDYLGIQGTIVAYEIVNGDTLRLQTNVSNANSENGTDSQGNFSFKIKKRSSDLENILIMTRQGIQGNYQGYVRTIEVAPKDTTGLLIRTVPYGDYAANPDDFISFLQELSVDRLRRFDLDGSYLRTIPGLENFNGLEKIRILDHTYFGDTLTFTQAAQDSIKAKIIYPNDISGIIGNYTIDPNIIVFGNDDTFTDYVLDTVNQIIIPRRGVIVVAPKSMGSVGTAQRYKTGPYMVSSATISLSFINGAVISHEFGHVFLGEGHPTIFGGTETVMQAFVNRSDTGPADKKAGKILYEPSYIITPPGSMYSGLDLIGNILRTNFK